MQTLKNSADAHRTAARTTTFPPLESITRPTVETAAAAYYLNRRPNTLRIWACCDGTGPIRPHRVNGRLAWPVAGLRKLLGVA